jgi:hypothetical protein
VKGSQKFVEFLERRGGDLVTQQLSAAPIEHLGVIERNFRDAGLGSYDARREASEGQTCNPRTDSSVHSTFI